MEVRKLRRGMAAMTSAENGECDGLGKRPHVRLSCGRDVMPALPAAGSRVAVFGRQKDRLVLAPVTAIGLRVTAREGHVLEHVMHAT